MGAALACLLVYLTNLAHLVLVQHATCVAHDEVVHASNHDGVTHTFAEAESTRTGPPEDEASPGDGAAGHAEDHCLALAARRRDADALVETATTRCPAAFAQATRTVAAPRITATAIPIVRLAPKTSPPAWA